jgi:hypothetical protein
MSYGGGGSYGGGRGGGGGGYSNGYDNYGSRGGNYSSGYSNGYDNLRFRDCCEVERISLSSCKGDEAVAPLSSASRPFATDDSNTPCLSFCIKFRIIANYLTVLEAVTAIPTEEAVAMAEEAEMLTATAEVVAMEEVEVMAAVRVVIACQTSEMDFKSKAGVCIKRDVLVRIER